MPRFPPNPKITLHHLVNSRSTRVLWCLEELGLRYDVKVYQRNPNGTASADLKNVSRIGKAPVLQIDNETLCESGYIINTLLTNFKHAGLETPPGDSSIYWSHFSEGSLMAYLASYTASSLSQNALSDAAANEDEKKGIAKHHAQFSKWAMDSVLPALEEAELYLDGKDNFTGTELIGAGDFMMMFPLNAIAQNKNKQKAFDLDKASAAYVERMRGRPAYKRAEDRRTEEEEKQK